jgi:hypothetical protein
MEFLLKFIVYATLLIQVQVYKNQKKTLKIVRLVRKVDQILIK